MSDTYESALTLLKPEEVNYDPAQFEDLHDGYLFGKFKNYRLKKKLGESGMGQTWLAEELVENEVSQRVVLKILTQELRGNADALKEVRRVFDLTKNLNHSSICPLLGRYVDPNFGDFLVMKYADGGTLADWFNAADRFSTCAEFIDALTTPLSEPAPKSVPKTKASHLGVAVFLLLALFAGLMFISRSGETSENGNIPEPEITLMEEQLREAEAARLKAEADAEASRKAEADALAKAEKEAQEKAAAEKRAKEAEAKAVRLEAEKKQAETKVKEAEATTEVQEKVITLPEKIMKKEYQRIQDERKKAAEEASKIKLCTLIHGKSGNS